MQPKHLIVPTQYFDPETFQVNHLVSLFLDKGWYVTVIAPIPSYPTASDLRGLTPTISHERLHVCRIPVFLRNGSRFSALLNSLSFFFICSIVSIYFALRIPYAHIFAVQYSPFTCILPAWLVGKLLGHPLSLWVFDLWPQSASAFLGKKTYISNLLNRFLERLISTIYSSFSNLYISSPTFASLPPVSTFPSPQLLYSWESSTVQPRLSDNSSTATDIQIISIGNLGFAHDLNTLQQLLLLSSTLPFSWTFVGGGTGMSSLQQFCSSNTLHKVTFHGFQPKEECLSMCAQADLSIIPFRNSQISNTICYRFITSLSVATPVISLGFNSVSSIVLQNHCGYIIDPHSSLTSHPSDSHFIFHSIECSLASILGNISTTRSTMRSQAYATYLSLFSEASAFSSLAYFFP